MTNLLKRLLGNRAESTPLASFSIQFAQDQTRLAVRVPLHADANAIIQALELPHPTPTIVISGGAGLMDTGLLNLNRTVIDDGLARFLDKRSVSLLDGGTSVGAMLLIGVARHRRGYTFPLVGIAPEQLVAYPGSAHPAAQAALDANHTHFVLTNGEHFGAESETIIHLAYALSGSGAKKRLVMIVNGGEVVKHEAHRVSTQNPRFPLLVLEGSGRFADELAASRKTGSSDPLIQDILKHGDVYFISTKAGADNLYHWLENFFGYTY